MTSSEEKQEFTSNPYYEGFQGTIEKISETKYLIKGKYEVLGPYKIRITELPVGTWTEDFKEYLEELLDNAPDKNGKKPTPVVKDYDDMSKDTTVDFIIALQKGKLEELEAATENNNTNGVHKLFKLTTTQSTNNMHLFDADDKLKKYATVTDIIEDYFTRRLVLYDTRKKHLIDVLQKTLLVLSNKVRYIQEILQGTIDLRNKKRDAIVEMLRSKNYDILKDDDEYKYLVKMPMDSVSEENMERLNHDHQEKSAALKKMQETSIEQMWLHELEHLKTEYLQYRVERERSSDSSVSEPKKKKVITKPKMVSLTK